MNKSPHIQLQYEVDLESSTTNNYHTHNYQSNTNQSNLKNLNLNQANNNQLNQLFICNKIRIYFIISFIAVVIIIYLLFIYAKKIQLIPTPIPLPQPEPIIDDNATKQVYRLTKLNSTSALCLDGSPAHYYISQTGDPSKILIFFQVGGWCGKDGNLLNQTTLQNCYSRSKTQFGSSKIYQQTIQYENNVLSKFPKNYYRNWKKVLFNYCDGSGFQGTRKQPVKYTDYQIYFREHNITTQRFDDLEKRLGLFSKASNIVLTGWSAGGLAVYTWANYLGQKVKNGKVFAIPDAGIFPDGIYKASGQHQFKLNLKFIMQFTNEQIDPPTFECIKQFPDAKQNCMFAQNLHKHIKVPLFAVQYQYDWWSVAYILGIRCDYTKANICNEDQMKIVHDFSKYKIKQLKQIVKNPGNGAWGIGCNGHGITDGQQVMNERLSVPQNSNNTVMKSIVHWLQRQNLNNNIDDIHIDQIPLNVNKYCG